MKKCKKLLALLLASTFLLAGCGSSSSGGSEDTTSVLGGNSAGEDATELSYWTFVDLHGKHFEKMLELWNAENPDRQIKLNVTVMPYNDMHNKLLLAVQTGKGAPDIADVEVGKFPNFLSGDEVPFVSLSDVVEPYKDNIVESRLGIYSRDGEIYGFPTHVGATVAFYNVEILEQAGVDYRDIITWDDYKEAGIKVYETTGKYLGSADTNAVWQSALLLTQQGLDLTDENGNPTVNTPELQKGLEMLVDLQQNNVIKPIAGGHSDTEEAKGEYNVGNYASTFMPLWYMSRFTNEITDLEGKIAIAPLPVFEVGQPRSLGLGGTGTVVTKTAKDIELCKDFLTFAKISDVANVEIWNTLGFDPVNTDVWTNKEVTHNPDNEFVQYFVNNPFDVLNEIKDEIEIVKSVSASPVISDVLATTTLNAIFEDGVPVADALADAQAQIEQELK